MALHRLTTIAIGVPNVAETAAYYAEFGLSPNGETSFTTADGGEQLRLTHSPMRRLVELGIRAEDPDDLHRIASRLVRLGGAHRLADGPLPATDPGTGVTLTVTPRPPSPPAPHPPPTSHPARR